MRALILYMVGALFIWVVIGACVVVALKELAPMRDERVEKLVLWTWPIWLVFLAVLLVRYGVPPAWKRRSSCQ